MNLHNASLTSKPEELVPSRYAVRIGEIDVLVVSDGVLPLPTTMLAHNADPAVRTNWLKDMFLPPDAFDWALNAVMVRSGDKTILIDAGLGSDPNLHLPRAGQLIKRLEAAAGHGSGIAQGFLADQASTQGDPSLPDVLFRRLLQYRISLTDEDGVSRSIANSISSIARRLTATAATDALRRARAWTPN